MITPTVLDIHRRLEEELPPLRQVAVRLLHLVGDPTVSMGRIVDLLRTDSVLTLRLLRVANSPLFAARQKILDVRQAVSYLGFDLVRSLAVTAAMRGMIADRPNSLDLAFWRHSLTTSLVCRKMAPLMHVPPETAYTAGLVHDVGQLGLMRLFPDYGRIIGSAVADGERLVDAELRLFEMDHCQAGQWMLSRWGMPLELQSVAAGHERPSSRPTRDRALIALVQAGSLAANYIGMAVIPPAKAVEPQDIAALLIEDAQPRLLDSMPELVEWVLLNLNSIEMSLF